MGTSYLYKCGKCGHEIDVSGGLDCGFHATVKTMVCRDCNDVFDVLVGAFGKVGKTGDPEYDRDMGHCPECSGENLEEWPRHRPCPKCGGRMRKQGFVTMWD